MKRPNVIDPPDYKFDYDCDPGVCSCPACGEFYELAGRVILCGCGFSFPTDWWPQYSKGCHDGLKVSHGAELSGGMQRRLVHHPYYRFGFEHPVQEAWKEKDSISWQQVVVPIQSLPVMRDFNYCDRCGKDKTDGRENRSGLCQRCEADTTCAYWTRPEDWRTDQRDRCAKSVDLRSLVGDEPGWALKLPCRYFEGGCPVHCDQFQPIGIDAVRATDEAMSRSIAKTLAAMAVVPDIKRDHKGEDWQGVVECPVCQGKLHVSHAAYNGHVHGRCETDDCVAWME